MIDMSLNGSGIRDTAWVLKVSPTTVMNELKKQRAGKRLRSIQVLAFQGCEQERSFFFERALRMILRRCIAST